MSSSEVLFVLIRSTQSGVTMEENESLTRDRSVLSYGSAAVRFFRARKGPALSLAKLPGEELACVSLACSV